MSLHGVLRASARIFFSLALLAAMLPLTSGDAEARRRVGKSVSTGVERNHHSASEEQASPEQRPADLDDATADTGNLTQEPVRPIVRANAARVITKPKDIDVPGCAVGMICTVCIAGCNDGANPIVHAVPKGH